MRSRSLRESAITKCSRSAVHKHKESICIIGAGASGIVAAISAKRRGAEVMIVDRMAAIGRKILACGAGRCNLLNERLDESFYNNAGQPLVKSVLAQFGKAAITDFFSDIGLVMYTEGERIFPVTNQAASVLQVLANEMKRLAIVPQNNFEVTQIEKTADGYVVRGKNGASLRCTKLIVAAGGKSYPDLGSNGSGFVLARQLGHSIVEPVPAAVPLIVKDAFCHQLQGQRIVAGVQVMIDGCKAGRLEGDLLFTRYGVSGTAILDVSRQVSVALHRNAGVPVRLVVDLVPFMQPDVLKDEIFRRFKHGIPGEDILAGLLPDKFNRAFRPLVRHDAIDLLVTQLKGKEFIVSGTRGWNEAEFTAGGISTDEIDHAIRQASVSVLPLVSCFSRRGDVLSQWRAYAQDGKVSAQTGANTDR